MRCAPEVRSRIRPNYFGGPKCRCAWWPRQCGVWQTDAVSSGLPNSWMISQGRATSWKKPRQLWRSLKINFSAINFWRTSMARPREQRRQGSSRQCWEAGKGPDRTGRVSPFGQGPPDSSSPVQHGGAETSEWREVTTSRDRREASQAVVEARPEERAEEDAVEDRSTRPGMSGELAVGGSGGGGGGGNPGKSKVSAKEVVGLGETKQTTRRAGKRSRSDRAAPLGRGKRTPMGVVGDSGRSSRRLNSTVSRELEGDYIRPRDSGNGPGGEVGLRGTATVRETQTGGAQVQQQGKGDVRCRDRGTDSEESHRMSGVPETRILRPSVSQAEEGWLHEAGLQPETVEQVPEVSTLQNGKHGNGHHLDPEEGLVHQDRPQRCVLDGTGMSGRQEVPSICMERASVAVSSPGVWTGFGPRCFTKLMKPVVALLRRIGMRLTLFLDDALAMNQTREMGLRDRDSVLFLLQKLGFVPVTEAGLHNQLEEVGIAARTNHGISGVLGELDGYDAVITSEQDIGYPLALPGYDSLFFGLSETTGEIDWEVDSNSFSHHSRPVVLQATSDVEDQGTVEGTAELQSDTHIDSGMQDRAGMVGRIPGNLQWSIVHCSEPGHDNKVRCLESWVGSGDREQQHAGSLGARREQLPYQPIGVTSCGTRAPSIHKEQDADASALTVRQQDGRCLSEQARRNTVVTATPRDERRLGILHATEDHNYCGISAGEVELPGGSREQSVSGQQQLAIGYSDFCSAPITMGDHDHGFIRRSIEHTTESVCELEAGPISEGDVCISPVLSGKQMPREVDQGQGGVGVNNADMAHSDVVSQVIGDVGGGTDPVTGHGGPAEAASGAGSPFDSGRQAPTSSVADQWQGRQGAVLSEQATKIMEEARRQGTRKAYRHPWE